MIRPLSPARLEQAAALEAQCFSAPLSRAGLAALLNNPACLWLAAEEGSRLLGYAGAHRSGPTAQLLRLAVAPEARRRGIGSALLEALCAALRGAGADGFGLYRSDFLLRNSAWPQLAQAECAALTEVLHTAG